MEKIKSLIIIFISLLLILVNNTIFALDLPFKGNEDQYMAYCVREDLNDDDINRCREFMNYTASQSFEIEDEISDIEKEISAVESDINELIRVVSLYEEDIDKISLELDILSESIAKRQTSIDIKNQEIYLKEQNILVINNKIRDRMVQLQKNMRFNTSFEFLMGATSYDDLLLRINGLNRMEEYENKSKEELYFAVSDLEHSRNDLLFEKSILDHEKKVQEEAKAKIDDLIKIAENTKNDYMNLKAELENQGNKLAQDLGKFKNTLKNLAHSLNEVPTTSTFIKPVSNAVLTAGTWSYPSGGLHLGADYAAASGTPIRAPANGLVVYSTDGCGVGYLGARCRGVPEGTYGGGNQIYIIGSVENKIYGFRYLHLLKGSPVKSGTILTAGDTIGLMGSSGNSTGTHVHVEIIYLGEGSIFDYSTDWINRPNLSFGAGFGIAAKSRICPNSPAPCRIRPEEVFGG